MLHFTVIYVVSKGLGIFNLNHSLWHVMLLMPLLAFGGSYAASYLSNMYFESPFLALKNRFSFIKKEE